MSTVRQSMSRVFVTPQGYKFTATVTADNNVELTPADSLNNREVIKLGPSTISGLTSDQLDQVFDPNTDNPQVVYWAVEAWGALLHAAAEYYKYKNTQAQNAGCKPVTQSSTVTLPDGTQVTNTTTIGCPAA